ncbi:hypothetical protein KFL_001130270 [Klebsormidium nitens]|uniref:EGF-like domain-containing protein n=1 Tax=Klebsormidium nitens TaxID=105231 RepID=A0A0U9HJN8_KLENI|nr:hypothetical protein KFL_001130270 [Klebsormidium nitens]|eukprot:GAQ82509.1 hypothetical protein KFL_001130270 [Klebsormidium nitens]
MLTKGKHPGDGRVGMGVRVGTGSERVSFIGATNQNPPSNSTPQTPPPTMAAFKLLLVVSLCLAVSVSAQTPRLDPTMFTCPTGFIPFVSSFRDTDVGCVPDPCVGACVGGTCTRSSRGASGFSFTANLCTCQAPAVVSQIVGSDFCYVPGTNVCNPSPCKNGATCAPVRDFVGQMGAYTCTCPRNYYGRNCDIMGPFPTPTPKGMPAPSGPAADPYTTF